MEAYVLIDITLAGELQNKFWLQHKGEHSWIEPVYGLDAPTVSPVLITIEGAETAGHLDLMMELLNARRPQLGVSFIESELGFRQMLAHLRTFIFVRTESGEKLTFRFADCIALAALRGVMTTDQWRSIVSPIFSWKIHARDGKLTSLIIPQPGDAAPTPLLFLNSQLAQIKELMSTDQLLFNLRQLHPFESDKLETLVAYELANQARHMWHSAGKADDIDLLLFARSAIATEGKLLETVDLLNVLAQKDLAIVRREIQRLVSGSTSGETILSVSGMH
jgi:hypothetical protein